jgi:hypothetical protein
VTLVSPAHLAERRNNYKPNEEDAARPKLAEDASARAKNPIAVGLHREEAILRVN